MTQLSSHWFSKNVCFPWMAYCSQLTWNLNPMGHGLNSYTNYNICSNAELVILGQRLVKILVNFWIKNISLLKQSTWKIPLASGQHIWWTKASIFWVCHSSVNLHINPFFKAHPKGIYTFAIWISIYQRNLFGHLVFWRFSWSILLFSTNFRLIFRKLVRFRLEYKLAIE